MNHTARTVVDHDETPAFALRKVAVTVPDLRRQLQAAAEAHPDLARLLGITDKMLVCLDTLRDECRTSAWLAGGRIYRGDGEAAIDAVQRIVDMCGMWGDAHELTVVAPLPVRQAERRTAT